MLENEVMNNVEVTPEVNDLVPAENATPNVPGMSNIKFGAICALAGAAAYALTTFGIRKYREYKAAKEVVKEAVKDADKEVKDSVQAASNAPESK